MQTKRESKSLDWLGESKIPPGQDPLLLAMKERGIPLTRANYLKMADLQEPLPAELEAELPIEIKMLGRPESSTTPDQAPQPSTQSDDRLQRVLKAYPQLTPEQAREMLDAFGG
jgi:hypothetical protein